MRELSLHILDLVQNSIEAGALQVILEIIEDTKVSDTMTIRVTDDGRGMDEATRKTAFDPFVTTRATCRVGLGLSLIDMSTKRCGGYVTIDSAPGRGTAVEALYKHSHLDRQPLGNIVETVKTIVIANPDLAFRYCHTVNNNTFSFATQEITGILGNISLTHPDVLVWLHGYLTHGLMNLYGGVQYENN